MANIAKLRTELGGAHPVSGPYSDDAATAAAQLNEPNRKQPKASLTGTEVMQAIDPAEFNGLSDTARRTIWDVLHLGTINPFGVEATLFTGAFGAESKTIAALIVLRQEDISRAVECGIGRVRAGDVQRARA